MALGNYSSVPELQGATIDIGDLRRSKNFLHPDTMKELEDLNFVWDNALHHKKMVMVAIERYFALYGTTSVPREFVVPALPDWPDET